MSSVSSNKLNTSHPEEIDLGRLIGELIDHRKVIITVTAIITAITIIYAILATPIYQSDALIQVEQKQGNAILNSLSQVFPDSQPQSAPEITLLHSRMILGKTVDDLNLQAIAERKYFPIFGRGLARLKGQKTGSISFGRLYLPAEYGDSIELTVTIIDENHYLAKGEGFSFKGAVGELKGDKNVSIMINQIDATPGTIFNVSYISRLKAIENLKNNFSVTDNGKDTGILTLSFTSDNPSRAKKILESISNNYLEQNIDRQAAQDAKSLLFLDKQLPKVRSDLDESEGRLNLYRQQKDSVDLSLEAKSILDQIVNADNQLNELTFRESEISQLFTKSHPTYKALIEKRQVLEQEKAKLTKRVSAMPATQQEVLRLSRDVESGRAVYMMLLNRQQELSIAKSSAIGNVRIIDNAITNPIPVKPKKMLIVIIGFILGLMLSTGLVLLKVLLRRGIESPEQLEDRGINVYASVPVSESSVKQRKGSNKKSERYTKYFLALENPADLAIEAIRGLRTSLHFAMMEAHNNVLMISGASPNAGKTFISSNLAAVIAQTGQRVLFIDTDMRKGCAHILFNTNNRNGLSDFLSGSIAVDGAIKTINGAGFDFISRGQVPPNPAELLMHARFGELINWASANYDLVIIDTPPVLAVTDAAIIGNYAGTTLLVAKFEENTAKEIEVSIKRFEQNSVNVKGCILNGVVRKASSYYGYGYNHYGYSYKDSGD